MKYDLVIIGGGIVGLSVAYSVKINATHKKILVIEKEEGVARHQTGHNSGVIHSGVYYNPGSKKAQNCLRGYRMLLDYCDDNGVAYEICGKLIVASTKDDIPRLQNIYNRGVENGLGNLKRMSIEEAREIEPHLKGEEALYVPQTGIIDYKSFCNSLQSLLEKSGVEFKFLTTVIDLKKSSQGVTVICKGEKSIQCDFVVTCMGLYSDRLSQLHQKPEFKIIPFRGEYYKLKPEYRNRVRNLIYPVPNPQFPFLGVHFTRTINGDIECGPNAVLAFKREGYSRSDFDLYEALESIFWPGFWQIIKKYHKTGLSEFYRAFSKRKYVEDLNKLIEGIDISHLVEAPSGVRAQACSRTGGLIDDFYWIESEKQLDVCNAPSPAATSSLSIGLSVAQKYFKLANSNN